MIIRASDIRQHIYCPRETYFSFVVPVPKPLTFKMEHGKIEHVAIEKLETRRNLTKYNLKGGEKIFSPNLFSPSLSLSGKADLIVIKDNLAYPIDYKVSSSVYFDLGYKLQLLTYARIIENEWSIKSDKGFLYFVNQNSLRIVEFDDKLNSIFDNTISEMKRIIEGEVFPSPPRNKRKCIDCRFRRWCGDV